MNHLPGDLPVTTTDLPERFQLASETPSTDRLAALRTVVPEAFREDKIDFEALRRSLGDWVDPGPERFGLTWPGKAECIRVIQEPSIGTLVPMPEESVEWENTQNVIVEGDNLEVLKLLQKAYYAQVKVICIDPPYNTGQELIYPDNFKEGLRSYLRYSGQVDADGLKLTANTETDGRYHSKWLSMMYPRLFLARNLLREDGLLFVTVGPQELAHLIAILTELFGEENFLGTVPRVAKTTSNKGTYFAPSVDYVLVVARNADLVDGFAVQPGADYEKGFKGEDPDGRKYKEVGLYQAALDPMRGCTNQRYWIECPDGSLCIPPGNTFPEPRIEGSKQPPQSREDNVWRWSDTTFAERRNEIVFKKTSRTPLVGQDGRPSEWNVYVKQYLDRRLNEGVLPRDFIADIPNAQGTKEISRLGLEKDFDFAKPTGLVRWMLSLAADPDALVLDFFAGSGTTGHAVMAENAADNGKRRFILVQLPEPTERGDFRTISDVTRERIVRAGAAFRREPLLGAELDTGFRSYHLAQSNFRIWQPTRPDGDALRQQLEMSVEHVTTGATEASMLTELLLKAGYSLSSPIETLDLAGVPGHSVADGALIVCLSRALSIDAFEAMVEREPAMILVLDAGFGESDELKVNALQTVRARNQSTGSDITLRVV